MLPWDEIQIGTWVTRLDLTFLTNCSSDPTSISEKLYLSRTAPDGSATFTAFDTETSLVPDSDPFPTFVRVPGCNDCSPGAFPPNTHVPGNVPFRVVPDGQGGAFIPWWKDLGNFPNYQAHLAHVSGSAVTDVTLPLVFQNTAYLGSQPCPLPYFRPGLPCTTDFRVVLGENGVIFATDLKSVVALDATMAPLWTYSSAAGMDLVAATADGGVTINDFQQGLVPLDARGNPSQSLAQATLVASYSWTGLLFGIPSESGSNGLALFSGNILDWAHSFWAAPDGSPSSVNASVEMPWFPPLPSCPGAQTPCANEALEDALSSLRGLLSSNCSNCQTWVFSKPQIGLTQASFNSYLDQGHKFYDVTRSYAPANKVLCVQHSIFNIFAEPCPFGAIRMIDLWQQSEPAALSKTPSPDGMVTFFDPAQVNNALGIATGAKQNQATIFHEALHGSTGLTDGSPFAGPVTLESIFGICFQPSQAITNYLSFHIFGIGAAPTCP